MRIHLIGAGLVVLTACGPAVQGQGTGLTYTPVAVQSVPTGNTTGAEPPASTTTTTTTSGGTGLTTTAGGMGSGTTSGGTSTGGSTGHVQVSDNPGVSLREGLPGSGTGGGQATINGTVNGTTLTPKTAVFDYLVDPNGNPLLVTITFSQKTDFCDALAQSNNYIANDVQTTFYLQDNAANGNDLSLSQNMNFTVVPSSKSPPPGPEATTFVEFLDGACTFTTTATGSSGTVTLTTLNATSAAGTFDLVQGPNNDHTSGTFTATPCPGMATNINAGIGTTPVGCQQQ